MIVRELEELVWDVLGEFLRECPYCYADLSKALPDEKEVRKWLHRWLLNRKWRAKKYKGGEGMFKVSFDNHGITDACPSKGNASYPMDCLSCPYFKGTEGFTVYCGEKQRKEVKDEEKSLSPMRERSAKGDKR